MRTELFDFDLPAELIAQRPAAPRDAARLLVVGAERQEDRRIAELPELLAPGDLLVFNDTRVIPARLEGRRGAARVEITLHQSESRAGGGACWRAFARPARRLRPGDRISFGPELAAEVVARGEGGEVTLAFDCAEGRLLERLEAQGRMPLPPYIRRPEGGDPQDRQDYQTLFARHPGAVAAPTAALHFTAGLMQTLAARGIQHAFVTLHVGAGTFLPVKPADTAQHRMHAERFALTPETAHAIGRTRRAGGRVVAVGTTVLRTLETVADDNGAVAPGTGETRLFITPGHRFRVVDRLLTNFHLPRSTLFMLVAAFAGLERMQAAYGHAIAHGYRFYSYGDACLLERAEASG
jgi:S-adenosylmethionine:tRNA ribosyltransferase-isomerase